MSDLSYEELKRDAIQALKNNKEGQGFILLAANEEEVTHIGAGMPNLLAVYLLKKALKTNLAKLGGEEDKNEKEAPELLKFFLEMIEKKLKR